MNLIFIENGKPLAKRIDTLWHGFEEPLAQVSQQPISGSVTLQLLPDVELEDLRELIAQASLVLLELPTFTDGRVYSIAAALRQHYQYTGCLRVFGDVRQDQIDDLHRCGIDSFVLEDSQSSDETLTRFNAFGFRYQRPFG